MIDWLKVQRRLNVAADGDPGPNTFGALFAYAAGRKPDDTITELGHTAPPAFTKYEIMTANRICFAVAEGAHETGNFTSFEEKLGYSAKNLAENWPLRYAIDPHAPKGQRMPNQTAVMLAKLGPEAIANDVYARPAMGNTKPGDGWKYRGRGFNQQTFQANYKVAQDHTGLPFVSDPDMMAKPGPSLIVACDFWARGHALLKADQNDRAGWRLITNGGTIGLDDFEKRVSTLQTLFA